VASNLKLRENLIIKIYVKKIIKYLLNFTALSFMIFYFYFSYAIIVRVPNIERLMNLIYSQVEKFALVLILFNIIITFINYVFERKIEKRKTSYEFTWLLLIHTIILILAIAYYSNDFYKQFIKHPEYF
jgi:uncharacterized membrane protein (DUF373 family)